MSEIHAITAVFIIAISTTIIVLDDDSKKMTMGLLCGYLLALLAVFVELMY